MLKIDPYINIDPGTMSPIEHGEVFVTGDGAETDLDLGNYERFLNITLPPGNYMTTGSVYQKVIERERNLEYKGKCVQIIPHVTNEVIQKIEKAGKNTTSDVVIIEVGGTVGDYENHLFTEAARQMRLQNEENDVLFVMLSFIPYPKKIGEMKTKPTQQAVRLLNSAGVQPDIIIARSEQVIDDKRKEKIALLCNVKKEAVISAPDVESIYDIPLNFEKDGLSDVVTEILALEDKQEKDLTDWSKFVDKVHNATKEIKIAVIGKYFNTGDCILSDSYISVIEAIKHAAYNNDVVPIIDWIDSEKFEHAPKSVTSLKKYDGIIVPGGFGSRGIEGVITSIKFARENKLPYLGLCYGMQLLVVEFARNVVGLKKANTIETDPETPYKIIDLMEEQKANLKKGLYGASMRLGTYPCVIKKDTIAHEAYGKEKITNERHRHRFEVNNAYIEQLEAGGVIFSGTSPDNKLMEIAELPKDVHPFMIGSQFHPEFTSSPLYPNPLFNNFIKTIKQLNN
jgi:CTP synthase